MCTLKCRSVGFSVQRYKHYVYKINVLIIRKNISLFHIQNVIASNCNWQIIISGISKNAEISPLQCVTSICNYPYFHSNETNTLHLEA